MPTRLFFSRLPGGDLEFSCLVPLAEDSQAVSWHLESVAGGAHSLSVSRPFHEDELRRGRAVLAAVLPGTWPESVLTVDLGDGASHYGVGRFAQTQRFAFPLATHTLVVGGHRIGEPHRVAFGIPSQQFGWDLAGLRSDGLALLNGELGSPPRSAEFACFGQEVLSPAAGIVVAAIDGIDDADTFEVPVVPPEGDLLWAIGNHVVIEHEEGVHSCLAHLKRGSPAVSAGESVSTGAVIGAVGSSGNVSGPHLHFHLMDGPDPLSASPLPVELSVEGETFAPVSGQIVSP